MISICRVLRHALVLALFLTGAARELAAQDSTSGGRAFSVFLDCSGVYCDQQFVRTEITSVDWVRERTAADVHVLVTTQTTGSGGDHYTVAFVGQRRFAGMVDTLEFNTAQSNTPDDTRRALVKTLQLGLVRYLARTRTAERLTISYAAPKDSAGGAKPAHDPWNAWVFSAGANAFNFREESYSNLYMFTRLGADRVTEGWKTSLSISENYQESRFDFGNGDASLYVQRSYYGNLLQVKSLTPHWSAGLRGSVMSNTYYNERITARLTPAVEYDVFPYAEATRRQLRLQYGLGAATFSYYDTTLFGKLHETMPVQTFTVAFSQRQTWGSLDLGTEAISYLNDLSRRHLTYSAGANLRIVKGLSLRFNGAYESIHDQFYIPKETVTHDDALLRQTQQSTRFSQYFSVGLNYSFGSVFNNVVNPRFGGTNE